MSRSTIIFCFLLAFATLGSAFYDHGSKVVKLTAATFREKVVNSNELWFVEFYAPWCGHCQRLTPEWEKLAGALKGMINVGAVDMTTDQEAGAAYGIRGFPTIKFFGSNKNAPEDYQGDRSARDMVNFAFDQAKKAANSRLSGGSSGGYNQQNQGGNQGGSCGGGNQGGFGQQQQGGGSCGGGQNQGGHQGGNAGGNNGGGDQDVVVLTDANFDDLVMNSEDLWIIEFYAPWCGHCKNLEPEWNRAATELKGEVKVGKLDATREHTIAGRYNVNAYPQIKLFPSGPKSDNLIEDYSGARDASSIVDFCQAKKIQYKPVQKVEQLVNQQVFDKLCTNLRGICFIAFLPHIYDSSAEERNNYIEVLQELAKSNRANPVTFLWAQGGDYYPIEESLGLASGYPSLVAISVNKMKYAHLTGSFSKKNVDSFVKSLIAGKQGLFDLRQAPKVNTVNAWDGKNSKPQYETSDL